MIKGLDFRDERVNFVQIGLGTNSTFIQNLRLDVGITTLSSVACRRQTLAFVIRTRRSHCNMNENTITPLQNLDTGWAQGALHGSKYPCITLSYIV